MVTMVGRLGKKFEFTHESMEEKTGWLSVGLDLNEKENIQQFILIFQYL